MMDRAASVGCSKQQRKYTNNKWKRGGGGEARGDEEECWAGVGNKLLSAYMSVKSRPWIPMIASIFWKLFSGFGKKKTKEGKGRGGWIEGTEKERQPLSPGRREIFQH